MLPRLIGIVVVALVAAACNNPVALPELADPAAGAGLAIEDGLVELPPLEGETESRPTSVNSSGVVVGKSGDQAVVWRNGAPEALELPEGGRASLDMHVNDAGSIAGSVSLGQSMRAVRWDDGDLTDLGMLPGHVDSRVTGISEAGHVAGVSYSGGHLETRWTPGNRGFVWHEGRMTELPPLPGHDVSLAYGVNSDGTVLGVSVDALDEAPRFVMWQDGEIVWSLESGDPHAWYFLWVGITDAGDAFVRTDSQDELWRWRDGAFSYYPSDGYDPPRWAWDVTPGGLILGEIAGEQGLWRSDDFVPFDASRVSGCSALSDGEYAICEGPGATYPVLTSLSVITTPSGG